MEDRTRELAMRYMDSESEKMSVSGKMPAALPPDPEKMAMLVLGKYGAIVRSRGMDMQVDDETVTKVDKVVKWMYGSRRRGLLLCGTLGNGKTTMLRALSSLFGLKAAYMEAQAVYDYYRKNQALPQIPRDCIVLLDDLGVEPVTYNDFGELRYPLAEFLMQRYSLNQTVVVATNLNFDEIGNRYGDRLQDRMREMFAVLCYVHPSYRR